MKVFLIRHAQSDFNLHPPGALDAGLTMHGLRQAQALAEGLRDVSPSLVLTSPMRRAVETALVIADVNPELRPLLWAPLHERIGDDMSGYEGMSPSELLRLHPRLSWWAQPVAAAWWAPPDETSLILTQRADAVVNYLRELAGCNSVVLLTHNVFGLRLLSCMTSRNEKPIEAHRLLPCAITTVELPRVGNGHIIELNDVLHLTDLPKDMT